MAAHTRDSGRRFVSWLAFAAAAVAVAVLVAEGPPGSGYGWGSVAVSSVLVAVPPVAIGVMVRAGDRRHAWPTVVIAALVVVLAPAALLGNWSGQSATDRLLDLVSTVLMAGAGLGAILVQAPLLRRHTV